MSSTHEPIVVGVDASWRTTGAVEWALDEALRSGAALHIVHVIEDIFGRPYDGTGSLDERAEHLLALVHRRVRHTGPDLTVDVEAIRGQAGPALAGVARHARMLIVGRRGTGSFGRLLVGSTSESAVHHADVPVVVVPDGWLPQPLDHRPVVAGVDAVAPGDAALDFAFGVAAERAVPIRLVHLWELPNIYTWETGTPDAQERWLGERRDRFDEIAAQWRQKYPGVTVQQEMREDHPVAGLVATAAEVDAQSLVVGGKRHNRLAGLLLGSVGRGVLHHARCPVAVVHIDRLRTVPEQPAP